MSSLSRDLRYGARMLLNNSGFALAAIITLALGIGANTAIFTIASALLLRPLPYTKPQQLVSIESKRAGADNGMTLPRYELTRDNNRSFEAVAVYTNDNFNLTGHGDPVQVAAVRVSANFFRLFGVSPQLGRTFAQEEGRPEGHPVVMLSNALWHSRFGGDRNIIGAAIALDGTPHTVIGVLPADVPFPFVGPADIWTPRYFEYSLMSPQRLRMGVGYLSAIARLNPGVTVEQANAELAVLNRQYREHDAGLPDADAAVTMAAIPLREQIVADSRLAILLLFVAVGLVLLVACANVASLLLSRGLARRKEIAVRTALGANRGGLIRQLLTESLLLAVVSGALGTALAAGITNYIAQTNAANLPRGLPISVDGRVLIFTVVVTLLTGVVFGILPALQVTQANVSDSLREEGRGSTEGHRKVQARTLLVGGQVALSLVLLIGAGLLVRSFSRLLNVDAGFNPHNVLTLNISLPTVKYASPQQQIAFFDELVRRVSSVPGVRNAAVSAALPLTPKRITPVLPEGQPDVPLPQRPFVDIEAVSPRWFQTMRVPVEAGRPFNDTDNAQSFKVTIVNQAFASRYWPNQNGVGKHVLIGRSATAAQVVGVAADVKNNGVAGPLLPQIYVPFAQLPWGNMNLLIRTAVDPHSIVSAVRAQVAAVDPDQPVTDVKTLDELMDSSRAQPRFTMLLVGSFSITTLVLAIVGLYGMLAYAVEQRRQELRIRLALGAEKADILRLVVQQGIKVTVAGIIAGLALALVLSVAVGRILSAALYEVSRYDLLTFAVAPIAMLVIAFLASYLPARRAAQFDAMGTLRSA